MKANKKANRLPQSSFFIDVSPEWEKEKEKLEFEWKASPNNPGLDSDLKGCVSVATHSTLSRISKKLFLATFWEEALDTWVTDRPDLCPPGTVELKSMPWDPENGLIWQP